MKWFELANKLGWSSGYLSKVFHGNCIPSSRMADMAKPILKRTPQWWQNAALSEKQAVLERARRAK